MKKALVSLTSLALVACGGSAPSGQSTSLVKEAQSFNMEKGQAADTLNKAAIRLNIPLFFTGDANGNGQVDRQEVRQLLFFAGDTNYLSKDGFAPAFAEAFSSIAAEASRDISSMNGRERLVAEELNSGTPTLIHTDLSGLSDAEKTFVSHMLKASEGIDAIYAKQTGMATLADRVAADAASRSLFRRNWGPKCKGPKMENEASCSALEVDAKGAVDVYPSEMQSDLNFCDSLAKDPKSKELMAPFSVVRRDGEGFKAIPYSKAYDKESAMVANELEAAATAMEGTDEKALVTYLRAAAASFRSNDWFAADEAWAAMNVNNSTWYVRVGPDETYWEPCSRKAGFHMTFARINRDSIEWQEKLKPLQDKMEGAIANIATDYNAREVAFHLPDFIDIVINAGDDRDPYGATIGQSLPNWGPVANGGRGRTVAMSNLYTDAESMKRARERAASILDKKTLDQMSDSPRAGLLSTILHEATHNLGPAHEYKFENKTAAEAFGGGMASMLEEFKAQSGALFYLKMLKENGVIDEEMQYQTYLDSFVWALGHISRGMYTASGKRKAYSQLAAIQVGFLMDEGVVTFDPEAIAANGVDKGAFSVDLAKFPAAADKLMGIVANIKGSNDVAAAEAIAKKYVDGDTVPMKLLRERFLRFPKASFVFSVDL